MEHLVIQLIAGALGGNLVAALFRNLSLGTLWNSIAGIAGGGLGGQVLAMIGLGGAAAGGLGAFLGSVASGGVGGGILMAIIGVIRGAMSR